MLDRWKIAHAEYRAEVALGWDRAKLFVALSPALTTWLATTDTPRDTAVRVAFVAAALVAFAGALIVLRSHARYRAARAVVQRLEDELGFADLETTGGQREARGRARLERFRVVDIVAAVLVVIAGLDVALALM